MAENEDPKPVRIGVILDPKTRARIDAIKEELPELRSVSAVIRHAVRVALERARRK